MNNDEWIAKQDAWTTAQRQAVEEAKGHYLDAALQSWLNAALTMMKGTEEHIEGLRGQQAQILGNQPLITAHLERQDSKLVAVVESLNTLVPLPEKVEAVSKTLDLLRVDFQSVAETVNGLLIWQQAIDDWRRAAQSQIDTFEITRRESRLNQDRLERKIDDQAAKQDAFHQESSADRKSLHHDGEILRQQQEGFKTQLDDILRAIENIRRWQQGEAP